MGNVPGEQVLLRDDTTSQQYYRYVPSNYDAQQRWPLVVTCHGTIPWDTAHGQIHEWRGLAEKEGFIVVAPVLKGTNGMLRPAPEKQIALQQADEETILSIVGDTRRQYNIPAEWVFLVGWSGGGYAVYHTGLRNPDVFRAVVSRMGTFDPRYFEGVAEHVDPYQPVYVFYAGMDLPSIADQCRAAVEWMRDMGMRRVTQREIMGGHFRRPEEAARFFRRVVRLYSYVRVHARRNIDGNPQKVQFWATVKPEPIGWYWQFGDGESSTEPKVIHTYDEPGTYEVTLTVVNPNEHKTSRTYTLDVK